MQLPLANSYNYYTIHAITHRKLIQFLYYTCNYPSQTHTIPILYMQLPIANSYNSYTIHAITHRNANRSTIDVQYKLLLTRLYFRFPCMLLGTVLYSYINLVKNKYRADTDVIGVASLCFIKSVHVHEHNAINVK